MAKNTTTRWDALSMRDRASLIKLYSQSGIRKLDDMRAHYNKFDTGGDKEPWYQTVLNSLSSARDARIGAVGAQQVRDLYSSGNNELANDLAKKYTIANGIGIAGGAVTGVGAGSLGTGLAKGIDWFGKTAMPSALLKSPVWKGAAAKALSAAAPYADAAALSYWSALAGDSALKAYSSDDKFGAIAYGSMAALPVAMPLAMGASRGVKRLNNVSTDPFKIKGSISLDTSGLEGTISKEGDFFKNTVLDDAKRLNDFYSGTGRLNSRTMWISEPQHLNAAFMSTLDEAALHGGLKTRSEYRAFNPMTYFDAADAANEQGLSQFGIDFNSQMSKVTGLYKNAVNILTDPKHYYPVDKYYSKTFLDRLMSTGIEAYVKPFIDDAKIIVNENGTINKEALQVAYKRILEDLSRRGIETHSLKERYHSSRGWTSLYDHVKGVVKTAQEIPIPEGSSRAELVRAALAHDIGKLITGQETAGVGARHPVEAYHMIDEISGLQEFNSPSVKNAVLLHMDDELHPIFGSHGNGTVSQEFLGKHGVTQSDFDNYVNWDLVHALQAADVARGMKYDYAAMNYPQLFMYRKQLDSPIRFATGSQDWELKNVVNPILKRQGYPVVHSKQELIERLNRHNSFYRGVRDPAGTTSTNVDDINARLEQARLSGTTPQERMETAATSVSPVPSSSGRAELFSRDKKDGRIAYGPTDVSKRLKVSPTEQDAIYVSVSPNTLAEYADPNRMSLAARVQFPLSDIKEGEGLASLIEKNDFNLLSATAIARGSYPMGNWQMFEQPYRLQTGRSLQSDMAKAYTGPRVQKQSRADIMPQSSYTVSNARKAMDICEKYFASMGKDIGLSKSIFKEASDVPGMVVAPRNLSKPTSRKAATDTMDKYRKYVEDPLITAAMAIDPLHYNIIGAMPSPKTVSTWSKNGYLSERAANGYRALSNKVNQERLKLTPDEIMNGRIDELEGQLRDYLKKYILTPRYFKAIKVNFNKLYGPKPEHAKYEITEQFRDYLKSPSKMLEFMRGEGVSPVWEMPSFGDHVLVGNGGHRGTWGERPVTRNKRLDESPAQGYIVGKKGEKLLEINKEYTHGELSPLSSGYDPKFRDDGRRYQGEDPEFAVTRKTYANGGDKDVSKNLAYKIGAYAHDGAGITPFGILDALTSKQKEYDELKAFIYGPETAGFTEYTGLSRKPFFNKQAKVYNGNINPNNEYVFPENMKGFLEEVASRNGNIYLNADLMPGSEKPRYDAANYPLNLQFDSSGNIIGNAADLYDFDPDYTKRYKNAHKWQAKIMEKQGNPYIVRQDNIPFRFVGDVDDKDAIKTLTAFSYGELGSPADISDAAIVNVMERLGNGTIEPSVVKADLPTYYEYYNADNYANGGKIYIKPKNRGKFNALLKRTGKSASWFKAHGTPLQRKRATFALNAKKWKHANGGTLDINTKFFDE